MRSRILLAALLTALVPAATLAEVTAITGATVHTVGPAGTIENATVVIEDGRIVAVGSGLQVPAGAAQVDAAGKVVTPGLFTPMGQIGLVEVNAVDGTVDYIQRGDRFSASFDVASAYNPRSTLVATNRIEGITHALIAPEPSWPDELGNTSNVFSGLASVVNLGEGRDFLVERGVAVVANLGETGSGLAAGSRAAALMVADRLAQARVPVVLDALGNLPRDFDHLNARLDSASILAGAGVRFAIGANGAAQNHNARNVTQSAGIAVANGLAWEDALAAITLAPAQIYGVNDEIGSLEPGKRADLVVWETDPLELASFPEQVYIGGQRIDMVSRQTLLRDRYLDPDAGTPPAFR